jgi:hypothetical protein
MARYRHIDVSPRFLAVDLKRQLLLVRAQAINACAPA